MWTEADPKITYMLRSSLRSFRHEILVTNIAGISLVQQHGGADDNVPVFHSRRMNQLLSQSVPDTTHDYQELEGKGHWFEGVMTSAHLQRFYDNVLQRKIIPVLPKHFSVVISNPADMGPRGGIEVDQLTLPDQLGRLEVTVNLGETIWNVQTSNVRRFHILKEGSFPFPHELIVDGSSLDLPLDKVEAPWWLLHASGCGWMVSSKYLIKSNRRLTSIQVSRDQEWKTSERHGGQLGPLDSILKTRGRFSIRTFSPDLSDVALQISRNLFQYFGADSQILGSKAQVFSAEGNVISVAKGMDFPEPVATFDAISLIQGRGIMIRTSHDRGRCFELATGLGAIYVRPLPNERLELVIWGADDPGLKQAARLAPMLSGVGQPEFIIVSKYCAWKGAAGVLAAGSFDSLWKVTESSFIS